MRRLCQYYTFDYGAVHAYKMHYGNTNAHSVSFFGTITVPSYLRYVAHAMKPYILKPPLNWTRVDHNLCDDFLPFCFRRYLTRAVLEFRMVMRFFCFHFFNNVLHIIYRIRKKPIAVVVFVFNQVWRIVYLLKDVCL